MKKILYSLLAIGGLFATSCATFDDPVTEVYADGPAVSITVDAVTDSTFTFTVTPGENTSFYSVLVDQSTQVVNVDATSLYKGTYSSVYNKVINASESATFTFNMRDAKGAPMCKPNTSYVIYAVAGSKQGVVGEVATEIVATTDALAPTVAEWDYSSEDRAVMLAFNETAMQRGEGAITAQYYAYVDLAMGSVKPVEVAAENIKVVTQGGVVAIQAAGTPAGAYVTFSYEAGAFVDGQGNPCAAVTSGFSATAGDFVGLYGQNDTEAFAITAENITAPELGSNFGNWEDFMGEISFDFNVYANPEGPEAGALSVTYTNSVSTKTIKLASNAWMASGNKVYFVMPEACGMGDIVTVSVAEGAIIDVYGNANSAFAAEEGWLCSYGFTRDMFLGDYLLTYVSYYDNQTYQEAITLVADEESESTILIRNMFSKGTEVEGEFDGDYGTLTIPTQQLLGTYRFVADAAGNTVTYHVFLMEGTGADAIVCQLSEDGTITPTSAWGYLLVDEKMNAVGYYDATFESQAVKATAPAAAAPKLDLSRVVKAHTGLKANFVK